MLIQCKQANVTATYTRILAHPRCIRTTKL